MNKNVRTVRCESPSGATGHEHFFAFSAGEKIETLPLSVENNNNNNLYSRGFRVGSEHIYKPDGHNSAKHNTKHNIIITFLQHNAYRALYYS